VGALERYRRILGLRAAGAGPHTVSLPQAIPVVDACIMRMDAPSINDTNSGKAVGSILGGVRIITGGAALDQVGQLPGPTGVWSIAAATDNGKYFRPGHWRLLTTCWMRSGTSALTSLRIEFRPWNPGTQAFVARPFQGGTGAAASSPALDFHVPLLAAVRDTSFEFEAFFPEPWGAFFTTLTAFGANDNAALNFLWQLHCPLDDVPEALDPFVAR